MNDRLIARYKTETKQATDPLFTESERAERLEALKVQLAEGQHYPDYARKLYLIENCIYGVDIQPIATQISKLRFFISLLCDQLRSNWNESIENHGLLSLPNLEAKFVCANTLISLPDTEGELGLSVSNISKLRERLQENRHRIFAARTYRQKDRLKAKDMEIRDQIRDAVRSTLAKPDKKLIAIQKEVIENLKRDRMRYEDAKMVKRSRPVQGSLFGELSQSELDYEMVDLNKPKRDEIDEQIRFAQRKIDAENAKSKSENVTAIDKLAHMVAGWDPYDQNATSAFFDPKWMFNIENGFDIVIGNPPYVQLQANGGELAKLYMDKGYETYCRNGDIYCLFYEYGMKVLVPGGVLNFITSDKWMVAQYGELMRDWVLSKTLPEKLIDFAGKRIFESATVETNILILKKADAKDGMILSCRFSAPIYSDLGMAISKGLSPCKFELGDKWFVKSAHELKIAEKVRLNGKPLKDWDIKVNFGIKTGLNSAFIIDNDTRNELVAKDRKSAEILKPIFRGRDIQKYWSKDVVWLIATFPSMGYDIDYFISIKKHLLSFDKRVLSQSGEKNIGGEKGRNARKKTSNKWFETQDQISFYDEFKKPKIFWKRIGSILRFTYSEDEVYGLDSTCIMTGEHIKYLLAVLNSKMGNYLLKDSPRTGTGDLLISVQAMEPIRVPSPSQVEELPIINLIDRIIAAKKEDPNADTSALEAEIDQLVYKLYGLTEEEIAIVEGNQAQRLRLARPGCAGQDLTQGMSQAGGSVVGAPSKIRRSVKVARPIEECDDEELE